MRKTALLLLVTLGCISKGTDIPPLTAGSGMKVDPATNTVSVDPAKVPLLPACAAGQLIARGAGDAWVCTDTAPNATNAVTAASAVSAASAASADTVDSLHAADFLGAAAQAADSARLGGLPPASFAFSTLADGVADNAYRLGGKPPSDYLGTNASGVYALSANLDTTGHQALVSASTICTAYMNMPPLPPRCIRWGSTAVSLNGTFCSATATAYTGAFPATPEPLNTSLSATGVRAGKVLCEIECGLPAAHMCTAEELVRSAQLKLSIPSGVWFSSGVRDDCQGWTTTASSGSLWTTYAMYDVCSIAHPIACCL